MEHRPALNPVQKPSWYKRLLKHLTTDKFLFVEFFVLFAVLVISGIFGHQYIVNTSKVNQPVIPIPHIAAKGSPSPSPSQKPSSSSTTTSSRSVSTKSAATPSPSPSVSGQQCGQTLTVDTVSNTATCTISVPANTLFIYKFRASVKDSVKEPEDYFDVPTNVTCENSSSVCVASWNSGQEVCAGPPTGTCHQPTDSQTLPYNQSTKVTGQDVYSNGWTIGSLSKVSISVPYIETANLSDGTHAQVTLVGFLSYQQNGSSEYFQAGYEGGVGYLPPTYSIDLLYEQ